MAKEVSLKLTQEQADFLKSWLDNQIKADKQAAFEKGATMAEAREDLRANFEISTDTKTLEPLVNKKPANQAPRLQEVKKYLQSKYSKIDGQYIGPRVVMDTISAAAAINAIAEKTAARMTKKRIF